jgi:hypothetical protein
MGPIYFYNHRGVELGRGFKKQLIKVWALEKVVKRERARLFL